MVIAIEPSQIIFYCFNFRPNQIQMLPLNMRARLILLFAFIIHYGCAQVAQNTMTDSQDIAPNTTRISAKIISLDEKTASLKVISVVASGQGIINILSEGQQITIQLNDKKTILKKGEEIEVDLKEKMGVDASQSSYTLLRIRNRTKK